MLSWDEFFGVFFAILVAVAAIIISAAILSPCTFTEEGEISRWLEETQRVDITTESGWSVGVAATGEEPFELAEAYEGEVIPGGIKIKGERAEEGHYAAETRVESGTSLIVTEGRVFLTATAESDITLKVWIAEGEGFLAVLVIAVIALLVWVVIIS